MPNGQQGQGFDVNGARQAGYSDDEILGHLTQSRNFDVQSALKSGYSQADIINYLSTSPKIPSVPTEAQAAANPPTDPAIRNIGQQMHGVPNPLMLQGPTSSMATDQRFSDAFTQPAPIPRSMGQLFGGTPLQVPKGMEQSGRLAQNLPFIAGAAGAVPAASEGLSAALRFLPSTERAAQGFQEVMGAAKSNPVPITNELSAALSRYQQLTDAGGGNSKVISKLMQRVTDPSKGPLTYGEARDFYSNISRLSADEFNRLTPVMQRQVGTIRAALNDAVGQAASQSGKGEQYSGAMSEFAKASKMNKGIAATGSYLGEQLLDKLPWLATGYAAKRIYDAYK